MSMHTPPLPFRPCPRGCAAIHRNCTGELIHADPADRCAAPVCATSAPAPPNGADGATRAAAAVAGGLAAAALLVL